MSVNGITNTTVAYQYAASGAVKEIAKKATDNPANSGTNVAESESVKDSVVVYEKSTDTAKKTNTEYKKNTEMIQKLKSDADQRTSQLRSLVEKLMLGQGNAIGTADDMWSFLRNGKFTVDAATKAQAQADIAEDGYWGVTQTSDRILDFAKALCDGDPDKIEEMRNAFENGFKKAEKIWGGELPDISKRTYEATMKKFDDWAAAESKQVQDNNTNEID